MKKVYTIKNHNKTSLVEKISKTYSGVSQKFIRKSPGRSDAAAKPISSGSYDMTGGESDDHKIEIGAPVLISKINRLDLDEIEPIRDKMGKHLDVECAPVSLSSDSDNDVYMDAAACLQSFGDIKFSFFPDPPNQQDTSRSGTPITAINQSTTDGFETYDNLSYGTPVGEEAPFSLPTTKSSSSFEKLSFNNFSSLLSPNTPSVNTNTNTSTLKKKRSKSAQNLHKSELKVFLHRFPSLETEKDKLQANSSDVFPQAFPLAHMKKAPSVQKSQSWGANDTAISIASINLKKTYSHTKYSTEDLSRNGKKTSSHSSLKSTTPDDDFNMKSVSCQSLNAKNLFLSIDELNEITKQINESEEFNQEIDYEYCEHRSNLQPSERRITLLRKKNASIIDLGEKKEKISKTWSGLKHWFDEERDKIREVVHKHAAMQRVGGGTLGRSDELKLDDDIDSVNNNNNSLNNINSNNNNNYNNRVNNGEENNENESESGRTTTTTNRRSDNFNDMTKTSNLAISESTTSSDKSNNGLGKDGSEVLNGFKQTLLSKVSTDKTSTTQVLQVIVMSKYLILNLSFKFMIFTDFT
jgi:nostrin